MDGTFLSRIITRRKAIFCGTRVPLECETGPLLIRPPSRASAPGRRISRMLFFLPIFSAPRLIFSRKRSPAWDNGHLWCRCLRQSLEPPRRPGRRSLSNYIKTSVTSSRAFASSDFFLHWRGFWAPSEIPRTTNNSAYTEKRVARKSPIPINAAVICLFVCW